MCGRVLRHVGSYLYVGATSAKVPRLLQSCEHPARWPLISTDSLQDAAATDCGADACFVDPPYQRKSAHGTRLIRNADMLLCPLHYVAELKPSRVE
jgi:hypothetical protein